MRTRRFLSSACTLLVAIGSLMLTSTTSTLADPSESSTFKAFAAYGTASWIDAGGEGKYVIVDLDSGVQAKVYHGTTFSMECWYDEVLHRRFYGAVTSGHWDGNKGNIAAEFVRAQGPTPHC